LLNKSRKKLKKQGSLFGRLPAFYIDRKERMGLYLL